MDKEQGQERWRNPPQTVVPRRTSPRFAKKPKANTTSQDITPMNQLSSPIIETYLPNLNDHMMVSPEQTGQNRTEQSSGPVNFNQHSPSTKETYHNHMPFFSPHQLNNHLASTKRSDLIIQTEQRRTEHSSGPVSFNQLSSPIQETDHDHIAFFSPRQLIKNNNLASPKLMAAKRGDAIIQSEKSETQQSSGPNLTKMAGMCQSDSSGDEEAESEAPLVTVGAYRVRPEWAPLLGEILERHGDIAEGCSRAETSEWRSQFLEVCCGVVQFLREAEFAQLTAADVERRLRSVGELERQDVRVGWLRERLEDILEARQVVSRAADLRSSRESRAEAVGSAEKRLKEYELEAAAIAERTRRCELEAAAVAQRIEEVKGVLVMAHKEAEEVRDFISRGRAKVKRFYKRPLVDDLI